jgi:pimeloyl-ACP methyl ester carboxylesterase
MYTTDKMGQDILAVADACNVDRFILCGFSFGGNLGRYLAARSDRVSKMVMLGNRLSGSSDEHRQYISDFRARWAPVVEDARGGTFDLKSLSQQDQKELQGLNFPAETLPSMLAWSTAMLDWGTVTPADLRCPTLWMIGTENNKALESYREYETEIPGSKVQVRMLEGMNHEQEFTEIDKVLPVILKFVRIGAK